MLLKLIAIVVLFECAFIIGSAQADCNSSLKKVYVPEYNFRPTVFKTNWYNATLTCLSQGLNLARVESAEEQALLETMIVSQGIISGSFFISGTDLATNNQWSWFTNGKLFNYTNWAAGYPIAGAYDCVALNTQQKWINHACTAILNFVCEGGL